MNQEVKEKWLNALRSGEYIQGKDCLKQDNTFCCLGVLTDIYIKENKDCYWKGSDPIIKGITKSSLRLSEPVRYWAGLPNHNPVIKNIDTLSNLNDSGYSFTEIADLIEAEL